MILFMPLTVISCLSKFVVMFRLFGKYVGRFGKTWCGVSFGFLSCDDFSGFMLNQSCIHKHHSLHPP